MEQGTPIPSVQMMVLFTALAAGLFALDHVDGFVSETTGSRLAEVLAVTGTLGVAFGWCYWRIGLECAVLAPTLVDAFGMAWVDLVYF